MQFMIGRFIYKYNGLILLLTFSLGIGSFFLFPKLKTETSFKQFFPQGEPSFVDYESFCQKMGSSENSLVIALSNDPTIFNTEFLNKLKTLQALIDSMKEVHSSLSVLSLKKYSETFPGYFANRPYLQANHPERFSKDSALLYKDFEITQHFITRDARHTRMLLQLKDNLTLSQTDSLLKKIDRATKHLSLNKIHFLGRKYMESQFKSLISQELKTSLVFTLAFVILILFLLHRSFAAVIVPVICMGVSLLMLYGYMALFNRPLTIMSNLFPTIILIVGVSDVIHISSKFAFESLSRNSIAAMSKTLKEIGVTTFINSFTTAVGFLTLLTMSMKAMQSFGVDAAVGLMIAWLNSIFLLPSLLLRFKLARAFSQPIESPGWERMLKKVCIFTKTYPKLIVFFFLMITGVSAIGISFINTNNYVLTSLPQHNRLRTDYNFFDTALGGGRTFELIIQAKNNHTILDKNTVENIDKLEEYLRTQGDITEIVSPATLAKWFYSTSKKNAGWKLPQSKEEYDHLQSVVFSSNTVLPVKLIDSTITLGRLYGRVRDKGRKTIEKFYVSMNQWIDQNIDTSGVKFSVTGIDYITDIGHQLRIDNMTGSFLLEILIVSIIIGLTYQSFSLVLITFTANIIPILIIGGIMGFAGIELRGATTAIFAIGYVIAVDDTLHFINRFQLEKRKGLSTEAALQKTILHTGRALIITSLILLGGFAVLMHSSFGDVFMHGFLVSLIVMTGLFSELLLTPVMIRYFFNSKQKRERIKRSPSLVN